MHTTVALQAELAISRNKSDVEKGETTEEYLNQRVLEIHYARLEDYKCWVVIRDPTVPMGTIHFDAVLVKSKPGRSSLPSRLVPKGKNPTLRKSI